MEKQNEQKELKSITATYTDKNEKRKVILGEPDGERGRVYVRAAAFNSFNDPPIWYHGFETDYENLSEIKFHYADGTSELLGTPRRKDEMTPNYLVVKDNEGSAGMSDEIEKPHFMRRNDVPQQVVRTEKIAPGRSVKGVWIPAIPVIIVRDHPGIQSIKMPDPQQNGSGKELPAMDGQTREAMKKPAQTNDTTKE